MPAHPVHPSAFGVSAPTEVPIYRERMWTALCLLAILAAVGISFRPSGLYGDDQQYLQLVKGFFTGHPFENLAGGDGRGMLLRPMGYPLLLAACYPFFGQHWELYPWINAGFCFLLGVVTFFSFNLRLGKGLSLAFTLAMLCNPMIRLWSSNAYSEIPFTFFLVLFIYLFSTRKAVDILPFLAVLMVSFRSSGLLVAVAYGAALAVRKDWKHLGTLAGLLAVYLGVQEWYFGEIPGLQGYFGSHARNGLDIQAAPLPMRMIHNLRSLVLTLMSSTFFYGGYAWLPASFGKSLLCLGMAGVTALCLAVAAGRSVFLNLLIAGFFAVMMAMRPEDLVNGNLIPLIPLVYLGAGRLAAVAHTLYMPRLRQGLIALAVLSAVDGLLSMERYRGEFAPHDYSELNAMGNRVDTPSALTGKSPSPPSP